MATLVWDKVGERFYETGISKAVLYKEDRFGVPWNGLTSVDEKSSDKAEPVYFDGIKFNDIVTLGTYEASVKAFTYPEELLFYEGIVEDQTGFFVTGQPPCACFGMSYQTRIGDDVRGLEAGYKIHLLFNLTALPSDKTYETLSLDTEPHEFEWTITSIPEDIENHRPTGHIILDSLEMDPFLFHDLEEILYGGPDNDAYLPTLKGLATFIRKWNRLIITDNGDGTWTAYSPLEGYISMIDDTTFEITSDTAVYLDSDTYTISSTEKNEEDIWLP